jgi:hypothetical protein
MAGKPRQKVFCQSLTRRSKRPCLAKGFLCANGKYLCRFHGYNNIKGFNKPNYTDDKRINQLKALYQFRNKTREEVQEYYYSTVKPKLLNREKSIYNRRAARKRSNTFGSFRSKAVSVQLDEVLSFFKKKSKARE